MAIYTIIVYKSGYLYNVTQSCIPKRLFIQFSVVYEYGYLYTLLIECTKCRKSGQRSITAAEGQRQQYI